MKRYFLISLFMLFACLSFVFAEAVQVDCLLAGMRDPATDEPLNGGEVYTYEAGTSTGVNLYIDRDKTSTAPNPIILDAYGRAVVFGDGIYRFIVKNASGTIVWSSDGLEYQAQTSTTNTYMELDAGKWEANSKNIKHVANGVNSDEAVNKGQLDGEVSTLNTSISTVQTNLDTVEASLTTDISNVQTNLNAQEFVDLTDTPSGYSSYSGDFVTVNSDEDKLIFTDGSTIIASASFVDLDDTPNSYTGKANGVVVVDSSAGGLSIASSTDIVASASFADLKDTPSASTMASSGGKAVMVNSGGTGLEFVSGASAAPIGTVAMFAGSTAPTDWHSCDGSAMDLTTYSALHDAIGDVWGSSSGNFNLPDLRGLFVRGAGTNNSSITGITDSKGSNYAATFGTYNEDALQGHDHTTGITFSGAGSSGGASGPDNYLTTTIGIIDDVAGNYGTARVSQETKPACAVLMYIIKIQ